jgi:hypothetical protein
MYGKMSATTAAALPITGVSTLGMFVAALTLTFAGLALMKVLPHRG